MIHAHVVGRIGLDDVRSQLDRLPNERKNFERVAIHHVAAGRRIGLKDERLDHQRHAVAVALWFDLQNVLDALVAHFRLIGDAEEIHHHASGIEPKRLLDGVFDHAAEERARKFLAVNIRHVRAQNEGRLVPARQRLQESRLADGELNGVGRGRDQRANGIGEVFDAGKKPCSLKNP